MQLRRKLRPAQGHLSFRAEDGFALPLAASILVLASLLVLAAVGFATHNTDRANRDRDAVRAGQAADAGIDAAVYRMNKALFASQAEGVLGLPAAALAETACIEVNVGQLVTVGSSGGWCEASGADEQLDSGIEGGPGWQSAGYSYQVSTGVNVGTDPNDGAAYLVDREIVSVGTVDDVSKRVLARIRVRLGNGGNLLSPFEQVGYRTCPAQPSDPDDPASGC